MSTLLMSIVVLGTCGPAGDNREPVQKDLSTIAKKYYHPHGPAGAFLRNKWYDLSFPPRDPKFKGDKVSLDLGESCASYAIGGGGRYFVFHLKSRRVLAIFDVLKGKIVHEIPRVADDVRIAAGATKMVLVVPSQRLLQRWRFQNFKREKVAVLPTKGAPRVVLMGANSEGPLLLGGPGEAMLVDLLTLKRMDIEGPILGANSPPYGAAVDISADGNTVGAIPTGYGSVPYSLMQRDEKYTTRRKFAGTSHAIRYARPSADGSLVFLPNRIYSSELQLFSTGHLKNCIFYPTVDPRFFLAVRHGRTEKGREVTYANICTVADRRVIYTIEGLEEMALRGNTRSRQSIGWALHEGRPQFHFVPWAKVFVTLSWNNRTITTRRFDLMKTLKQSKDGYLFVKSIPPTTAFIDERFTYRIDAATKSGGAVFKLADGPKGMAVSRKGQVTWKAPETNAGKTVSAIVRIRDKAGREIFHSFDLIVKPAPLTGALRGWQRFVPKDGKFVVYFPGKPATGKERDPVDGVVTHFAESTAQKTKTSFRIEHSSLGKQVLAAGPRSILNAVAGSLRDSIKKKSAIKMNGHPALALDLEVKEGGRTIYMAMRIVIANRRMYQLMVAGPQRLNADAAQGFFDGFRVRK